MHEVRYYILAAAPGSVQVNTLAQPVRLYPVKDRKPLKVSGLRLAQGLVPESLPFLADKMLWWLGFSS